MTVSDTSTMHDSHRGINPFISPLVSYAPGVCHYVTSQFTDN